jgi:phage tail protein X
MSTTYVTREGDVLDDICRKIYGRQEPGQVEAVLAANPGLADNGFILPARLVVVFPDLTPEAKPTVRLW